MEVSTISSIEMGQKISKMKEKADLYYDQGNYERAIKKYKKIEV